MDKIDKIQNSFDKSKRKGIFALIKYYLIDFINYIAKYGKSVKDGYTTNAFAPLVWYEVFILPPLIVWDIFTKNVIIEYILLVFIMLIVLFTLGMYVALLIKDPKLLQSEGYRLEDKKIDIIAQRGMDGEIILSNPESLTTTQINGQAND